MNAPRCIRCNARRKRPLRRRCASILVLVALLAPAMARAWGNHDTHQRLTEAAVERTDAGGRFNQVLRDVYSLRGGLFEDLDLQPGVAELPEVAATLPDAYRSYYRQLKRVEFDSGRFEKSLVAHGSFWNAVGKISPAGPSDSVLRVSQNEVLPVTPFRLFISGVWLEDNPQTRARHHFHDPEASPAGDQGLRNLIFDGRSARDRALNRNGAGLEPEGFPNRFDLGDAERMLYRSIVGGTEAERSHALALHFLAFGHVMHLLADMASPAHVRNDFWIDHVIPKLPGMGQNLEGVGEGRPALTFIETLRDLSTPLFVSRPVQYLQEVNARDDTPIQVDLSPFVAPAPIQSTGFDIPDFWQALGSSGAPAPGLAEVVHDNFFSWDTVPGRNPGGYAEPAASRIRFCDSLPLRGPDGKVIISKRTGKVALGLFASSPLVPHLAFCNFHSPSVLNETNPPPWDTFEIYSASEFSVQWDYLELVFPLAVDTLDQLADAYFEPRLEVVAVGPAEFKLRNLAGQELRFLSESIEVAYDDVDGNRRVEAASCGEPGQELTLPPAPSSQELPPLSTFTCSMPTSLAAPAKHRDDFWVVVRGALGDRGAALPRSDWELWDTSTSTFESDFVVAFDHVLPRIIYTRIQDGADDVASTQDLALVEVDPERDLKSFERSSTPVILTERFRDSNPNADFKGAVVEEGGTQIALFSDINVPQEEQEFGIIDDKVDGTLRDAFTLDLSQDSPELVALPKSRGRTGDDLSWTQDGRYIYYRTAPDLDPDYLDTPLRRLDLQTDTLERFEKAGGGRLEEERNGEQVLTDQCLDLQLLRAVDHVTLTTTHQCIGGLNDEDPETFSGFNVYLAEVRPSEDSPGDLDVVLTSRVRVAGIEDCGDECVDTTESHDEVFSSISPDGNEIAFSSNEHVEEDEIYVGSLSTGAVRSLNASRGVHLWGPSWSPSGSLIAYVEGPRKNFANGVAIQGDIFVVPAEGGAPRRLTTAGDVTTPIEWFTPLLLPGSE